MPRSWSRSRPPSVIVVVTEPFSLTPRNRMQSWHAVMITHAPDGFNRLMIASTVWKPGERAVNCSGSESVCSGAYLVVTQRVRW
jgi:hypothetical protein